MDLGVDREHYYTEEDAQIVCPHCRSTDTRRIGKVAVDNVSKSLTKCNSCEKVFSQSQGFIKDIEDEAKENGAEKVGIELLAGTGISANNVQDALNDIQLDSGDLTQKLEEVKNAISGDPYDGGNNSLASKMEDLNTTMNNMSSNVSNVVYELQSLITEIRSISTQNHDLMERLVKDPLNGMRKAISDFNLE